MLQMIRLLLKLHYYLLLLLLIKLLKKAFIIRTMQPERYLVCPKQSTPWHKHRFIVNEKESSRFRHFGCFFMRFFRLSVHRLADICSQSIAVVNNIGNMHSQRTSSYPPDSQQYYQKCQIRHRKLHKVTPPQCSILARDIFKADQTGH